MDALHNQEQLRDDARKELDDQLRLRRQVQMLEERDFQLWSTLVLVFLIVTAGLAGVLWPDVVWGTILRHFDAHLLPQLFYGFITLVILFNIYILKQKRELRHDRENLVLQMVYNEAAERLSLVDPLTDTFNRRYMDQVIAKDLSRAERQGIKLGFLLIDVDNFKSVNTQFGHLVGDRVLVEVASVLKRTFRASDIIIRFGGDEFLVMLADTREDSAHYATDRLNREVARWNSQQSIPNYTMALSWGFAIYAKGDDLKTVLTAADRKMYEHKNAPKQEQVSAAKV